MCIRDSSQDVLDERTALGAQGFAAVACAVSFKRKTLVGEIQLVMRGITGGDDIYLAEDCLLYTSRCV